MSASLYISNFDYDLLNLVSLICYSTLVIFKKITSPFAKLFWTCYLFSGAK